jgi:glutathione synthase/RimK-type ligase-like ATP-grasp enzyme
MKYLIIDKKQRVKTENKLPYASLRITEELKKKNLDFDFAYLDQIEIIFQNSKLKILVNGVDPADYSHILFRGHSLGENKHYETKALIVDYIEQQNATKTGSLTKVQNSDAIKNLPYYDKIWMSWICAKNDTPFFETYYRANGDYIMKRDFLTKYPLIIKHYCGENDMRKVDGEDKVKKNVYKLENANELQQEFLKEKDLKEFFIQEFSDEGEDMRIFVSKNKVVGGWRRKAKKGFMTVSQGEYIIYNDPSPEIKELAIKTSKAFKADFIATDFMFKDGKPYLQEISLHPGFKAYEEKATGDKPVNIAKIIIESF